MLERWQGNLSWGLTVVRVVGVVGVTGVFSGGEGEDLFLCSPLPGTESDEESWVGTIGTYILLRHSRRG